MSTVHKIEVYGGSVTVYQQAGEWVDVYGVSMVRLRHGTIVKPDGFHASIADAKRAAADKVDAISRHLAEQATQLRREADA
jgi:hypothetical protein